MSRAPRKPPLALDMDFGEALERFSKTDNAEVLDLLKAKKKKTLNANENKNEQ